MRYPLNASGAPGEQVMYSYLPQMTLDSVYVGTAPGNPIYVQGTKYDSAGRVTRRTLGSTNPVQTQYTYYPWNTALHGGKLQQIYTTRGTTPLQNFQYAYDSNANITAIHDYIVGSPQTQSFGYDNLDRLTSAGRATLRTLGSGDNAVQTRYNYYQWNASINGGKLQQIYTTRNSQPLQNFQYAYDRNSNITTIHDYIVGSPQTQSFGYDNLDRLTSAGAANGTQGNYGPEGYTYDAATGNLATKGSSSYNYGAQSAGCVDGALDKAHAAVAAGGNSYCYDKNGNMVRRVIGGVTYTLTYDSENHMTGYSGGGVSAGFVYDGDGRRVQSTVNGVTTQFVGSHVEWKTSTTDMVRYYYAGGVRVAMRTGDAGLVWLVGDHLGSTSIAVTDATGATERQGYKAWGEFRFGSLPTKYQFTGQRNEPEIGLYYYGARWYDSSLGRFAQADTIVPDDSGGEVSIVPLTVDFQESQFLHALNAENLKSLREQKLAKPHSGLRNSQAFDRYAYALNNALKYTDPTGHDSVAWAYFTKADLAKILNLLWGVFAVTLIGAGVGVYLLPTGIPGLALFLWSSSETLNLTWAIEFFKDLFDSMDDESTVAIAAWIDDYGVLSLCYEGSNWCTSFYLAPLTASIISSIILASQINQGLKPEDCPIPIPE